MIVPDTLLKWYSAYRDIWLVQSIGFPLSLSMTCYLMRVSMLVEGRALKDLFNCLLYYYFRLVFTSDGVGVGVVVGVIRELMT